MLGLVDTAVVGQFGDAALLGGLAAGAVVFDVVFTSFNFVRSGTTGLVAQAFGRSDAAEEQAVFWRAFAIAVVAGVVLAALAPLIVIRRRAGSWLPNRASTRRWAPMSISGSTARPSCSSTTPSSATCSAAARARSALLLQLVLNGSNIALSILLGLKLGWGVAGVAWGTVGGELIAALFGMAIVLRRFAGAPPLPRARLLDRKRLPAHDLAQPRHHDPLLLAARRLRAVHPAGRAVRHADAGRQRAC